jgi:hypothetical protein
MDHRATRYISWVEPRSSIIRGKNLFYVFAHAAIRVGTIPGQVLVTGGDNLTGAGVGAAVTGGRRRSAWLREGGKAGTIDLELMDEMKHRITIRSGRSEPWIAKQTGWIKSPFIKSGSLIEI